MRPHPKARREVFWLFSICAGLAGLLWLAFHFREASIEEQPIWTLRGPFTSDIAFLPQSHSLVAAGNSIRFYHPPIGNLTATLGTRTDRAFNLTIRPDGKQLVVGDTDNSIKIWDVRSGRKIKMLKAHSSIADFAFSPDSRWLVSGSWSKNYGAGAIFLWDVSTGKLVRRFPPQPSFVSCIAFAPNGQRFATAGGDGTVKIWDLAGRQLQALSVPKESFLTVTYSPDGRFLAAGGWSEKVTLWDVRRGVLLNTLDFSRAGRAEVRDLVFMPDSKRLCVAASRSEVVVVEALSGDVLNRYKGQTDLIMSLALSTDRQYLAASSWRDLRVWHLK